MSNYAFDYFRNEYQAYQSFNSVEAMKENVRLFRVTKGFLLSDSCLSVLKFLAKMSEHVIGVSWMNFDTIADKLGISYKTVERSIKTLETEGILSKHHRKHKKGGRRSILVLNTFPPIEQESGISDDPEASESDIFFNTNVELYDGLNVGLQNHQKKAETPSETSDSAQQWEASKLNSFNLSLKLKKTIKTNVMNTVAKLPIKLSNFVDNFLQREIPDFFKHIAGGLTPVEMMETWDRAQLCTKNCRSRFLLSGLVTKAWFTTRDMIKTNRVQSDDYKGLFYGTLRNLYEAFEVDLLQNNPDAHSEYFYEPKSRSIKKFSNHRPFITKYKHETIKNIAKIHNISIEEATKRYFS